MPSIGQINDMYRQLEEVIQKCDSLSQEIKVVKKQTSQKYIKEIKQMKKEHKEEVNALNMKIKDLEDKNNKLNNEVDRLKKQLNNNSNNSSLPPSSDIKPNKKIIPNNREKSGKKVGAQKGHKGHHLSKKIVEDKIKNNEYIHQIIPVGKKSDKYISKYVLDIQINVIAKEYRFYQDENGKYNIPKKYKTDVQYGSDIKALCTFLNVEDLVAIDRLSYFVKSVTQDKLNISNGSIANFIRELKTKSKPLINNIEEKVLNSTLMHTDATTSRNNNTNNCVRTYSTTKYTLLKATKGKEKKHIESTNILNRYIGKLCHDHETVMYNYGGKHGECNVHISRYLKGNYQSTFNSWSKDMRGFLCSLNEYKKELQQKGIKYIDDEHLNKYSLRYEEILNLGFRQNKQVKSKYYKKEEKKLLNRLSKYKDNHLMFIYDFEIPFDNNMAERDLRHVKSKQKISGCFRSDEGQESYLDIKSIILSLKKQSRDSYSTIRNIFMNTPVEI